MSVPSVQPPLAFLADTGATGALIAGMDWARTPLGPIDAWPQSLRAAVALMLRAKLPIVILWGPEGVMLYNDAYSGFAGQRHPRILGTSALQGWPEVADFNANVLKVVLGGGTLAYSDQQLMLYRNGAAEDVWLNLDYSPIPDENGVPAGVFAVVVETTEKVRVEQTLRIAQKAGGVGTFEWYPDTGKVEVSDEYRRLWGLAADVEVDTPTLVELILPEDRGQAGPASLTKANPLEYTEYRIRRSDNGEVRWIARRGEVIPGPEGGQRRFVGAAFDITDRKLAEAALAESEARFRNFAESMPNHVWTAPASGQLDWFNRQVYEYSGATTDQLLGEGWGRMVHPDDIAGAAAAWKGALRSGLSYQTEFRLRRADGVYRWHIARAVPIRDADGHIIRWVGTNTDIEDQKLAESALKQLAATLEERVAARTAELTHAHDALRQSQKMEAVGQLTGGIAHDFNNLLQGIVGSLNLVQKRIAVGQVGDLERFIKSALASAYKAAGLTHRLLAFSRRQPLDPKPIKVNPLVASMEDLLRRTLGERIELELVQAGGLWLTLCDANQLESAILNLVINARDAMPDGGRLTIETANAHLDASYAVHAGDVKAGQYICISVTDTGTGMTPDVLERAFDPFFTTKPIGQGTGLGLSMIYGFTRQSEGHSKIYSEPGSGTSVKLYLPRYRGEAAQEDTVPGLNAEHATGAGEAVLVVEDDAVIRGLVVEVLKDLGYRAFEAADGPSGLQMLQSPRRIDLLVTDIGLPGLNGRQVADAARTTRPDLKVLFMTGYAENAALANGFLEPGMEMVTKPFSMETLATRIRMMIESA